MISESEVSVPAIKLVMLGNSGVGKSSLINKWLLGGNPSSIRPTIGAVNHMCRLQIDETETDLFLWDTAGQEQFASLAPLYVRSTSVALITVDITDMDSFLNMDSWISMLKCACDDIPPMILAINKMDLFEKAVLDTNEIENKHKNTFKHIIFASAQTGENVDILFTKAAKEGLLFFQNSKKRHQAIIIPSKPSDNQGNGCFC